MRIGPLILNNNLIMAPMAGITDRPFRQLCKKFGAGLAISEMVSDNPELWDTRKSRLRTDHFGEVTPIAVQIAGTNPDMMAKAARYNEDKGAQIIDINMGCPAKKVCNVMAGSALMKDEHLVARILEAVVSAVTVPVTLKTRTGWDPEHRNAMTIAKLAESAGIAALTIHGRTRACGYGGYAEYETVKEIKSNIKIPIIANGDINTPQKAKAILDNTGVDGIMIGRAAQGRPWIFKDIIHYLETGQLLPSMSSLGYQSVIIEHLEELYSFYGINMGVRIARKHIGWYIADLPKSEILRKQINQLDCAHAQKHALESYLDRLKEQINIQLPKTGNLAA